MKHRRLPRPFHIAFCVLGLLAVLTVLRLMYGPPSVYGEKAILRRMERQNLRTHGELIGYWSDMSEQTFAFWDGAEILIYQTNWENKGYFAEEGLKVNSRRFNLHRFPVTDGTFQTGERECIYCHKMVKPHYI